MLPVSQCLTRTGLSITLDYLIITCHDSWCPPLTHMLLLSYAHMLAHTGLSITLDYFNMLVVMTFNIGLFVAVVCGYVLGNLLFSHVLDNYQARLQLLLKTKLPPSSSSSSSLSSGNNAVAVGKGVAAGDVGGGERGGDDPLLSSSSPSNLDVPSSSPRSLSQQLQQQRQVEEVGGLGGMPYRHPPLSASSSLDGDRNGSSQSEKSVGEVLVGVGADRPEMPAH